jgi:NAD(P)-dependent dehydrogenase (short-subunit alcohol dehydrogenase family)
MRDVAGKIAFITGGASGIGLGIAHAFVDAGMRVVLADLRPDHIHEALGEFVTRGQSKSVHAIRLDVTNRHAMAVAAEETERVFGKVHVLVNNAGVGIQGPFKGITYSDWDFGLAVNLGGVINGLQTFLPRIRAHGEGGHIVNTASLAALVPMPPRFVIYQTAKAAVVSLSECIRAELAQENIGVTVLCPGPVRTNIHEISRNRPAQFSGSGHSDHFDWKVSTDYGIADGMMVYGMVSTGACVNLSAFLNDYDPPNAIPTTSCRATRSSTRA